MRRAAALGPISSSGTRWSPMWPPSPPPEEGIPFPELTMCNDRRHAGRCTLPSDKPAVVPSLESRDEVDPVGHDGDSGMVAGGWFPPSGVRTWRHREGLVSKVLTENLLD